jgi:acyl-coenzyme A synthetase/AMP-(fatty) acid ligase
VADAVVRGRDDAEWGQAVVATVVLRDASMTGEPELRDFCRERLAGYKVPKRIEFSTRLPRDAPDNPGRKDL